MQAPPPAADAEDEFLDSIDDENPPHVNDTSKDSRGETGTDTGTGVGQQQQQQDSGHHQQQQEEEDEDDDDQGSSSSQQQQQQLLCCSFNQDGGCLAVGTASGFAVHNLHPYARSVSRKLRGGIGQIEMLFRCNLMALVGGGPAPHSPPHRVLVWDDHIPRECGELSFRQAVLRVRLRRDAIAVALRDRVYVYHLADLSLRDKIYTADNPHGLLCLSTQVSDMVLACPSVTLGHVRVELYGLRKTVVRARTNSVSNKGIIKQKIQVV